MTLVTPLTFPFSNFHPLPCEKKKKDFFLLCSQSIMDLDGVTLYEGESDTRLTQDALGFIIRNFAFLLLYHSMNKRFLLNLIFSKQAQISFWFYQRKSILYLLLNFKRKRKGYLIFVQKLKTIGILVHNFESSIFEIVFADSEKE